MNYLRKIFRFAWWIEQSQLGSILTGIFFYQFFVAFAYVQPRIKTFQAEVAAEADPLTKDIQYYNWFTQFFLIVIYMILIQAYTKNNKFNEEILKSMNALLLICKELKRKYDY